MPPRRRTKRAENAEAALASQEALRAHQEEALKERLKAALDTESSLSSLAARQVDARWRALLRSNRLQELCDDITPLKHDYYAERSRKDSMIESLRKELDILETHHQIALTQHMQNVTRLSEIHEQRQNNVMHNFIRDLEDIRDSFTREREELLAMHLDRVNGLNDIISVTETQFVHDEMENTRNYVETLRNVKEHNTEMMIRLRTELDGEVQRLQEQFRALEEEYRKRIDPKVSDFQKAYEADAIALSRIKTNVRRSTRLQNSINGWRAKLASNTSDFTERNADLKKEKDSVSEHFHRMKTAMTRSHEQQKDHLTLLVTESANSIDLLTALVKQAEKMLLHYEMASKLKTEEERILGPNVVRDFEEPKAIMDTNQIQDKLSIPFSTNGCFVDGTEVNELTYLTHFTTMLSKATADNLALAREHNGLLKEEEDLKAILRQYIEGISVREDALGRPNTLMVVNERKPNPIRVVEGELEKETEVNVTTTNAIHIR